MTHAPPPSVATPPMGTSAATPALDALHDVTLDLFASDDAGEVAAKVLGSVDRVIGVDGASLWVPSGDELHCRGALGEGSERSAGARIARDDAGRPLDGEGDVAVLVAGIAAGGSLVAVLRATRGDGRCFGDADRELLQRLVDAAGAAMESAQRLASSRGAADDAARDLGLITEMSREITSTLDLDRVLRTVVNLATRALTFDRGAIALYEHGACDIRAVAGAEGVDPKSDTLQDLAVRAAWAAGVGEPFYLSDRGDPASDAERTFVQIFGGDLERDNVESGLYLPLKDEEGIVGILLFESKEIEFASDRQRDLAAILASQATVAVRNAQLYQHVPLADALGALSARREAWLAVPRRRRLAYAGAAVAVLAALTLIRWPLRVDGESPTFRPLWRSEVRPTRAGVIDRVYVREGSVVERGAPVMHLRDDELRAERDAARATVSAAERAAAMAAARGDAAAERLQRLRADVVRREGDLLDEQIASMTVRAPGTGIVLTARPEERIGTQAEAGDLLAVVGRTDSLEVELGVEQRDVARLRVGQEVRLRVTALPQRTFSGRLTSIAALSTSDERGVWFPARATFANEGGLLRPGMAAYARVLTAPASVLGRLTRAPVRALRLFWWRIWS